jgi:hypothetical protein
VALVNATVTIWGSQGGFRVMLASEEEAGLVLGEFGRAEPPSGPLTDPVTEKAVAELNWTVSDSATVAPTALLIVALLVVLAVARRPTKSKALIEALGRTYCRLSFGPTIAALLESRASRGRSLPESSFRVKVRDRLSPAWKFPPAPVPPVTPVMLKRTPEFSAGFFNGCRWASSTRSEASGPSMPWQPSVQPESSF